jgi:hypothetical protein
MKRLLIISSVGLLALVFRTSALPQTARLIPLSTEESNRAEHTTQLASHAEANPHASKHVLEVQANAPKTPRPELKLSLDFETNRGQAATQYAFVAHGPTYALGLSSTEIALSLNRPREVAQAGPLPAVPGISADKRLAAMDHAQLHLRFMGASGGSSVSGLDPKPGVSNYFIGNDSSKWQTHVPHFGRVKMVGIYPGIDLVFYGNPQQLEYDFRIAPGADPRTIHLNAGDATSTALDQNGNLVLATVAGDVQLRHPDAYQEVDGVHRLVDSRFRLVAGNVIQFEIGTYDHTKPLIIDPVMTYGVAIGGSNGSEAEGLDIDPAGNAYVTGNSCSVDFPTAGSTQNHPVITTTFCEDAFVLKLDPTASSLIYSDFVGGSGASTGMHVAVDAAGDAFVTGATSSTDFPLIANIGPPASVPCPLVAAGYNCPTGFIFKLSPDGSSMIFSSLLGGSEASGGLQVKLNPVTGDAVVVGATNSSDFQPQPNTLETTYGGGTCADMASISNTASTPCFNGFLLGLNPTTGALRYGTYLGGSNNNWAIGLAFDAAGNAYVAGSSIPPMSSSLGPVTNTYAPVGAAAAGDDIFVAQLKLSQSTLSLGYLTLIQGEGTDMVSGIAVDSSANLYLTGSTTSTHLPVTSGAFQSTNKAAGDASCLPDAIVNPFLPLPCGTAFVGKLNAAGALSFLTYLGGSSADWGEAIGIDSTGNLWLTGITSSSDFPFSTSVANALYSDTPFLAETSGGGTTLPFASTIASQFGQSADLKIDSSNNVYVAGYASSATSSPGTYPVDPEVQNPMFVQKWSAGPGPVMTVSATSLNFGATMIGSTSAPQTVTISNTGQGPLQLGIQTVDGSAQSGYLATGAASPFLVTNNCGATLAPNSSCTLTVSLQPFPSPPNCNVANGCDPQPDSTTIIIQNNAPSGTQTVALTGTSGVGPVVAIAPRAITFPPQIAGTSSAMDLGTPGATQYVQISNLGDINLVLASATLGGPNAADFQLTNQCPPALPPGFESSCQLSIVFSPAASATGTRTATLNLVDNAADSPQSIPITGSVAGATAAFYVYPNPITFGYALIGGPTYADQVTADITNVSTATQVLVTGVTIGGPNAADFNLRPNGFIGVSANEGEMIFYFNPTSGPHGPRTATATLITSPPTTGLAPIPLQGVAATSTDPGISIYTNPSPLDLGSVQVGQSSQSVSTYLTIGNLGNTCPANVNPPCGGSLVVSSIVAGLSDYTVVGVTGFPAYCTTTFPLTLPPQSQCGYNVVFAPTQAGARNTTLTINSNDPGGPVVIPVTGVGLALPLGDLSATALNFGYAAIGLASPPLTLNLQNTSSVPLAISGVSTSANFEVASNTCSTAVATGASCTIGVTFTPPTAGAFNGTLTVSDNDAFGGQQLVALSGVGATGPSLMILPTALNFPNQANNTTGPPQPIMLTNFGDTAVTFPAKAFVTTSSDVYVSTPQFVISSNTCGTSLAVHASCVVNLEFAPTAPAFPPLPAPEPGTLNIGDNAHFSPQRVYLSGIVVQSGASQTTTTLTSSLNPATSGQPITFTAAVAGTTTNTPTPTGSVTFKDGTTILGTASLNSSVQATFTTSSLSAGSHAITAVYGSDANYAASTSSVLTEVVTGSATATTATTLTASPNPATIGQSVLLTATVAETSGSAVPTGTVTFYDGTTSLGTGAFSAGTATYSATSLAVDTHSITASYGGDASNSSSTSSTVTVTVTAAALATTATTLTASTTTAVSGTAITFTAAVKETSGSSTPTGTVTFYDGQTSLGTGTLSSSSATYSTSGLAVGTHSITASYGGDASNAASTSSTVTVTITAATAPDFTLAVSGTSAQTVTPGQSASYSLNVSPLNGSYPGTVTFAASGLPAGATASFSPSSIASPSGAQAVTLTIQTSAVSAMERAPASFAGRRPRPIIWAVFLLPLLGVVGMRRRRGKLVRISFLASLILSGIVFSGTLTGCGSSKPAEKNYSVTITATSGSLQHSALVTLNVE